MIQKKRKTPMKEKIINYKGKALGWSRMEKKFD